MDDVAEGLLVLKLRTRRSLQGRKSWRQVFRLEVQIDFRAAAIRTDACAERQLDWMEGSAPRLRNKVLRR